MPTAIQHEAAVCAGAHAHIFPIAPVQQVVSAFLAGRRVIGDLVGRQPGPLGHLLGDLVERQRRVGVGHGEPPRRMQLGERRLRLDGQLVQRQVPAGQSKRLAKLAAPGLGGLAGAGIDQIEAEALECFTCNSYPRLRLGGGVQPAQCLQLAVVERLHAERHAVDARRPVAAEAGSLHARWVRLQRDFGAGSDGPMVPDGIEDGADRRRAHQRGCAAAEEHAGDGSAAPHGGPVAELAPVCGEEARLIDAARPHVTVEVAIGALGGAERPMHVDAEFAHGGYLLGGCGRRDRLRIDMRAKPAMATTA